MDGFHWRAKLFGSESLSKRISLANLSRTSSEDRLQISGQIRVSRLLAHISTDGRQSSSPANRFTRLLNLEAISGVADIIRRMLNG